FFICVALGANVPTIMDTTTPDIEDVGQALTILYYVLSFITLVASAFFIWWSYNRYTKAQITSSFNK
ncbi:MAG: hypothetical protein J6T00_06675, partial [Bacteroidaceae bacterium]|nr:hypothetical protein [Bacteroidaceae bacterium]